MELHLYPSRLAQQRAIDEAVSREGVLLGELWLTYPDLFERLYAELQLGPSPIGPLSRQVLLHRTIDQIKTLENCPGLISEYGAAITALKQAALSPDDLLSTSRGLVASDLVEEEEITLLEKVYRRYQELLRRREMVDEDDRDLRILNYFQRNPDRITQAPTVRNIQQIVLHNLYDLSPVEHGILSCLIRSLPEGAVLIYFTDSLNVTATQFAERTWQRFVEDEALADKALPEFAFRREGGNDLDEVLSRLFLFPEKSPPPIEILDNSIEVRAVGGRYREAEEIGREIRSLLDQDVAPERMAILVRNFDQYMELIEDIARRFRIPIALRRQTPLFHLPITKWISSLLELPIAHFERANYFKVLSSSYLTWSYGNSAGVASFLNGLHYVRSDLKSLEGYLSGDNAFTQEIHARVKKISDSLICLSKSSLSFRGFAKEVAGLLEELEIKRALVPHSKTPLYVLERDREALQKFREILEELASLFDRMDEGPMSYRDFLRFASDAVALETLPGKAAPPGAIAVMGVGDAVGLTFDTVFLPGLIDTEFPKVTRESPVLSDRSKRHLNSTARLALPERYPGILEKRVVGRALPLSTDRARKEPLFFFMALESAKRRCVVSYPFQKPDGQPLKPSLFIEEVLRHFKQGTQRVRKFPSSHLAPSVSEAMDPGDLLRAMGRIWRERDFATDACEEGFGKFRTEVDRLKEKAKIMRARLDPFNGEEKTKGSGVYWGNLEKERTLLKDLIQENHAWSPTRLEEAGACAFAYFSRNLLSIRPRNVPNEDPTSLILGILEHQVIQEYVRGPIGSDRGEEREKIIALLERWGQQSLEGVRPDDFGYWKLRRKELERALLAFADYHQECLKQGEEVLFSEESLTGEIAISGKRYPMKGRADLVYGLKDSTGINLLRVEDIKYSRKPDRYKKLLSKELLGTVSFQLPIYAFLVLERLRNDGETLNPTVQVHGQYLLLRNSGKQPKTETLLPAITTEKERLFLEIDRLIDRVVRGDFSPSPHEKLKPCQTCDYGTLCRYQWMTTTRFVSKDTEATS